MKKWNAYWNLLRMDKPIGTLLLWYPTAWALWIANSGPPPLKILFLFAMGTLLTRASGCVINDMVDRNIDKYVKRTTLRPIASGELNLIEAFILLFLLLIGALVIALQLPLNCFYWALMALFFMTIYPFCKRFLNAPQMILGLAFSMGIPMAYSASDLALNSSFIIIFIINFLWIIAYDTMYAMTDKEDDLKIGVKSTAIYFAEYDVLIVTSLLLSLQLLWLYWGISNAVSVGFYFFWVAGFCITRAQQKLMSTRDPESCFKAFNLSVYYGLFMWLAVIVSQN